MDIAWSRKIKSFLRKVAVFFTEDTLDPLPIRSTFKNYNLEKGRADLRASLNVVLLSVPQGMAYAAIADLPIVYGVVCAAVAALVAPLFASSRYTSLGPTNSTALMVFTTMAGLAHLSADERLMLMPMLVLMVGAICFVGALIKVADLLQFISHSVLVGYISGAALLIMASQMKHLLGVAAGFESNGTFVGTLDSLFDRTASFNWHPFALGAVTLAGYLFMKRYLKGWPVFALALILFSTLGVVLGHYSGTWSAGLSFFEPFRLDDLKPRATRVLPEGFFHTISLLLTPALAVAFLASLENSVMAKSLAARTGGRPDVNQDMLAVGMANLASACTGSMPASGSLTRSALNFGSGARTGVASLLSGLFCALAIFALATLPLVSGFENPVSYVPKACLSALIIGIALSLLKWSNIRVCLRSTPGDAAVFVVTFLAALVAKLDVAIFTGVGLSIMLFLRKASKPFLVEYEISDEGDLRELGEKRPRPIPAISIVHVEGDLFFGAADLFRTQVQRITGDDNLSVIILRLKNARHLDATSVMALRDLIEFVRKQGRHLIVSGATREVYKVLKFSGVLDLLQEGTDRKEGQSNLFFYAPSNPNISTRDALRRAQELMGTKKADVKIFYDPANEKKK